MATHRKDNPFYNRYDPDNDLTEQEIQENEDDYEQQINELMEMSDEEADKVLDAAFAVETRKHNEWWNSLSLLEQVAHRRRNALRSCITNRILMQQWPIPQNWNESVDGEYFMYTNAKRTLKRAQMRLLKIREWRKTGIYPGEG